MLTSVKTRIFIDGANLYKSMKSDNYELDYVKFSRHLKDRYKPQAIYIFIGYIKEHESLYSFLRKHDYTLVFKETLQYKSGEIKGNVDAELIVQSMEDFYEINYEQGILVSGDGDFACLIDFWKRKGIKLKIYAPKKSRCSYLLKKQNVPLIFMDNKRLHNKITKKRKDP